MRDFLKFLEENCPGDDAHSGCAEPQKPLLERCGLCAAIYEEHLKEIREKDDWIKALETRIDTMTNMMAEKGLVQLSPCPNCGSARKNITCSVCIEQKI